MQSTHLSDRTASDDTLSRRSSPEKRAITFNLHDDDPMQNRFVSDQDAGNTEEIELRHLMYKIRFLEELVSELLVKNQRLREALQVRSNLPDSAACSRRTALAISSEHDLPRTDLE